MEDYTIIRLTSTSDVPAIATVFRAATVHNDTFWEMITRFGAEPPFDALLNVLTASVNNPNHHVFKVVHNGTGEVVGMSQWKAPCYVEVEKVDPFAAKTNSQTNAPNVAPLPAKVAESEDPKRKAGVAIFNDSRRLIGNAYITHIRGKKHVFLGRLAVHPDHQRKGIASQLMKFGTDFADRHGIVAWLNGRPAALKLYENFGFKTVHTTYFDFEDLEVAPVSTMLRLPVPGRKVEH